MITGLSQFVRQRRRINKLTQEDLAYKAGVGLRFILDLEQGKPSLRLDKVNQVLGLFGHEAGPVLNKDQTQTMSRSAEVWVDSQKAGLLSETDAGYVFQYLPTYLTAVTALPVSLTLPLREQPYQSRTLFAFFDGLIPEGWLLDIAENNWKIQTRDRFGLLLACCRDCIGTVSIVAL